MHLITKSGAGAQCVVCGRPVRPLPASEANRAVSRPRGSKRLASIDNKRATTAAARERSDANLKSKFMITVPANCRQP
jgi:hypothetical protein